MSQTISVSQPDSSELSIIRFTPPPPPPLSDVVHIPRGSSPQDILVAVPLSSSEGAEVLPQHAAETLSRALETIPFYAASHLSTHPDSVLNKATRGAAAARIALSQSLLVARSVSAAVARLVLELRDSSGSGVQPRTLEDVARAAGAATTTQDAISAALDALCDTARELDGGATLRARPRWLTALRVGGLCAASQSFTTGALSAVYTSSRPELSQALALVSASIGICGTVIPSLVQWYFESKDKHPTQAELQSVHIEARRIQHPLSLIVHWWRRLAMILPKLNVYSPAQAIHTATEIMSNMRQYTKQIASILCSVESGRTHEFVAAPTWESAV